MNVLLTRPLNQVDELGLAISDSGHIPLYFPSLEIKALTPQIPIDTFDILIFISANAVHYAKDYLENLTQHKPLIAAVGQVTRSVLEQDYSVLVDIAPEKQASSDALLALEVMQNLQAKKILIIRGLGGLETLKKQLTSQKNKVSYLQVYQRISAKLSAQHQQSLKQFLTQKEGVIMIHSAYSLQAFSQLVKQINPKVFSLLLHYPVVLLSHRLKSVAESYGFTQCHIAKTSNNKGLVEALIRD